MGYSVSPWNLIYSMKTVDQWTGKVNENVVGALKYGFKQSDVLFGGGVTNVLSVPTLTGAAKQIAEQYLQTTHTSIDFSQGELIESKNWTEFAIQGDGFFMTTTDITAPDPFRDIKFTRNGEWHIDQDGFLRTKEGMYVLDGSTIPGDPNPSVTSSPPWVGSTFDAWMSRESLSIKNDTGKDLSIHTSVELTLDTQDLISQGLMQGSLNDLRIGYYDAGTWYEIPREFVPGTDNTPNTEVRFRLYDPLPSGQKLTGKYFLFYNNPAAGAAPTLPGAGAPFIPPTPPEVSADFEIGTMDPDGVVDDFINSEIDPPGASSISDWINVTGGDTWRAGATPGTPLTGVKAGNIDYSHDGSTGYTINSQRIDSANYPGLVPTDVYRVADISKPGGWRFVDAAGNELQMTVISRTNEYGGTSFDPSYDFTLTKLDLNGAQNNLDPAKTAWERFDTVDYGMGAQFPSLGGGLGTFAFNNAPSPGNWNSVTYISPGGVTVGDSNFDSDDTVWGGTSLANNDYQYLLLRQKVTVGQEGIIRSGQNVTLDGFVDHDVTIVIRKPDGTLVAPTTYQDSTSGNNTFNTSFDPFSVMTDPGDYYIEVYASHEVASPPNVPPYNSEDFSSYNIGDDFEDVATSWKVGGEFTSANNPLGTGESTWFVTDGFGNPIVGNALPEGGTVGALNNVPTGQVGPPSTVDGKILYQVSNSTAFIERGDATWDDYTFEATFGIPDSSNDDDHVRMWVRIDPTTITGNGTGSAGPRDGYFFFINGNGMKEVNGGGPDPTFTGNGVNIGFAKMVGGTVTILADNVTQNLNTGAADTNLTNWLTGGNGFVGAQNAGVGEQYWRIKISAVGNRFQVWMTDKYSNGDPQATGTKLFDITDPSMPAARAAGSFGLQNFSQKTWYDDFKFTGAPDRKAGVKIDSGSGGLNGIQSIDAFENLPRYYTDGINLIDRFGTGQQNNVPDNTATVNSADANPLNDNYTDNQHMTSNQDGILGTADDGGLIDYDPGTESNVGLLASIPILDSRLVQFDPTSSVNPLTPVQKIIRVDWAGANPGTDGDGTPFLQGNQWNEYSASFRMGAPILDPLNPAAETSIGAYLRYKDANNWVRVRYNEAPVLAGGAKSLVLEEMVNGTLTTLDSRPGFTIGDPINTGASLKVEVEGRNYRVYAGNSLLLSGSSATSELLAGGFALTTMNRTGWFDDVAVSPLNLLKVKSLGAGAIQPDGPDDVLDSMYLQLFADRQSLQYDHEFGGVYFKQTPNSGIPKGERPGENGAGDLFAYKLEASNVDLAKQVTNLASSKSSFDMLAKQLEVYLDTIESTFILFR